MTLEQIRAQHAWNMANGCTREFKNLAKGAPALVMSNGLMPSLAFWQSKGHEHQRLVSAVVGWLHQRSLVNNADFRQAMESLQRSDSTKFMQATGETLEYLKWLRNFASAINQE